MEIIANAVSVPVVASGGAGRTQDVVDLAQTADVSGVAIASMLHYDFISRPDAKQPPAVSFSRIAPAPMVDIKHALVAAGCPTRSPRTQAVQ